MAFYNFDFRHSNVYGIYGSLGGGKTLSAVDLMVDFLSRGFPVTSNVSLRNIDKYPGKYTRLDDFNGVDWWSLPVGAPRGSDDDYRSCICIDEAAEFLDQYSSNSPFVKSFLSWLRHSSKRGQFVFLIVQRPEFLVKSARLLVNRWILCDDMAQLALPILNIKIPFFGGYCRRLIYDRNGNCISRGLSLINKSDAGRFYDTSESIATAGRNNDYVSKSDDAIILDFSLFFALLALAWLALIVLHNF